MAQNRDHRPATPVVVSPEAPTDKASVDDWNIPTAEEDEAVHRAFMRAQEGSIREFLEETKDDNL